MQFIDNLNIWGQKKRAKYLKVVFALLTKMKIRPNQITFLRFLGGLQFVLLFQDYPRLSVIVFLLAAWLDWFDGGLARYQKNSSDRGKFWDVLVDHLNYVLLCFTLLLLPQFSVPLLGYHLVIVPVLYLLAIIKESENNKTDWIIHPYYTIVYFKPVAALAILVYVFLGLDYINLVYLILDVAMTVWVLYYAKVLAKRWKSL